MNLLDFTEYVEPTEPDAEEPSGVLELPISGFAINPRDETVRLIGYISRGEGENHRRETTLILHVPLRGFAKSMVRAIAAWNRRYRGEAVH